jgi:hypothetical protein
MHAGAVRARASICGSAPGRRPPRCCWLRACWRRPPQSA